MRLKNISIILIILGLTLITGLILFSLHRNAGAGWQKTKWGMSIKEIQEVMPEQVKEIPENLKNKLVRGASYYIPDYTIGKYTFNVALVFDDHKKLKAVYLHYVGDQVMECFMSMKDELKRKYSKPSDEKDEYLMQGMSRTITAEWVTSGTIINIGYHWYFGEKPNEFMAIMYEARVSDSAGKL